MKRILILGGIGEANALARAIAARPRLEPILSMAGRTQAPAAAPCALRIGGFGGASGLASYLRAEGIAAVVDATHPFAKRMSRNAYDACARTSAPRLRLLRPMWAREPGDVWHEVEGMAEAARLLPALGRRALVTVGHEGLEALAGLKDIEVIVRSIEKPRALPPGARWLQARGPFALDDELALMRREAIEVVLSKASGGGATYAKIAAARALGLPVVMLRRPEPPPGPCVPTVEAALAWLHETLRGASS